MVVAVSHGLLQQLPQARWQPITPSQSDAFHISMLIPGIHNAYHMYTLGRCQTSIAYYRQRAAAREPELRQEVEAATRALTPADGMLMARLRGQCWLPYWSKLAICDYHKQGYSLSKIAEAFVCSERTAFNAVHRTNYFAVDRQNTPQQLHPPSKKVKFTLREIGH